MAGGAQWSQCAFCVPQRCQGVSALSGKVVWWQLLPGDSICPLGVKTWFLGGEVRWAASRTLHQWVTWSSPDLETPRFPERAAEVATGKG